MQDINTLKISIKHYSFSGSIHGKGGMKPKLMGPNFCYTIENISFWGCRKQGMVQSDRRMTSFLLSLRSGLLLIHRQERVQTSSKQLVLIWDSISSSKVHYHININGFNMHIVDEYMKSRYFVAMKGNYSKKYLSVPLWDKSVTSSIYIFFGYQSNAVFITHSVQDLSLKTRKSELWQGTVTNNNNDNDSFYRDNDILHVQMERAIHTQPPASHPSPPRQWLRPVQRWPKIGTTASMMGQRRVDSVRRLGGWCHSQWDRRPRTLSECNQSSHKSLGKLHISIYTLVWICDPALRVYAFSKFSIRIQYHFSDIPCTIYGMMIWRYL